MYNTHPKRKLLADMDKTQLLKMRDDGMSYKEIGDAVGCCSATVYKILGPMPPEMRVQRRREAGAKARLTKAENVQKISEGGYTVERKMQSFMPQRKEEPAREAVLAVKRGPVMLSGEFMDYAVSADGKMIEVEKEGRVLIQIKEENLSRFIVELQVIQRNIGEVKPMQFWG